MKTFITIALLSLALVGSAFAKDHSNDYQIGTFISSDAVADGTITSTLHGDGTTVAGGVYANHVGVYKIKVADGMWLVTPWGESQDSMLRGMGMTPMHLKREKANPLDGLKNGDRVLFRLHERQYINGHRTEMSIPYADKPDKEVNFTTQFVPDVAPPQAIKATDNVKAMCDAHKLSPELEKQMCTTPVPVAETPETAPIAPATTVPALPEMTKEETTSVRATSQELSDPRIARLKVMCEHGMITVPAVRQMSCDLYGFNYPGKAVK